MLAVFRRTMRDLRKGLVGWSIGIVGLVLMMGALWPTIRDMDMQTLLDAYPEALQELFNVDAYATGAGFFNAEMFSAMLPILFITYGIGVGAKLLAREEENGTMDVLLSTPLSRSELLLGKALAGFTGITVLGGVNVVSTLAVGAVFDMGLPVGWAIGATSAMVLMGLVFGGLAFAVGSVVGSRARAIAISATVAVAGYAFYVASAIVDAVGDWAWLTPFHHAVGVGPAADASAGIPLGYLWLALGTLLFVAVGRPIFNRRDIGI
jgi:ABC-2 type transport system permease protein